MARTPKKDGLELDEEIEFQQKEWNVQRIAWVLFAIVILLALFGLFGHGPLSLAEAASSDQSISLKYPRFFRFESEFPLEFHVQNAAAGEEVRLQLNTDYLNRVEIDTIMPAPESEITGPEWVTYVFSAESAQSPLTVYFHLAAEEIGPLSGMFRLENGETVSFSEFIFP